MESMWERQERVKKVAELADEDIERMYLEISSKFKDETARNNKDAEMMHNKSMKIDNHFALLRIENLRDMQKTNRRLSLLQQKPQMHDSVLGVEFDKIGDVSDSEEEVVPKVKLTGTDALTEQYNTKYGAHTNETATEVSEKTREAPDARKKYASRRASALTDQIMSLLPIDENNPKDAADSSEIVDTSDIRYEYTVYSMESYIIYIYIYVIKIVMTMTVMMTCLLLHLLKHL